MSFIQRFCWCRSLSTALAVHTSKETNAEFIKNKLRFQSSTWSNESNNFLDKCERNDLLETVETLKKLGFSDEDIRLEPRLLHLKSRTIVTRCRIYRDYCFRKQVIINTTNIRHFGRTIASSIHQLKREGYIDKYKNVLDVVNKKLKLPLAPSLNEAMSLKRIHQEYIVQYLMLSLNASVEEARYYVKKYKNVRGRSFKCLTENIDFLTKRLGFDIAKIKKHIYVLYMDKGTVQALLKTFPKLGDTDMKIILYSYPNLLLVSLSNTQNVIECVLKYGYTTEHISKAPLILMLRASTVEERLSRVHNEAWFQPYVGMPRALQLIFMLPGVERRRNILEELNMKCVSINMMSCSKESFNAYAKHGRDKLNGVDGFYYISSRLNVSQKQVSDKLRTHPYKRYVPLQQMHVSLTFLLEKFSEETVFENLQLVLYPVNVIESALSKLEDTAVLDASPCHDDRGKIQTKYVLPLTLYVIERENNFSGYGVWEEEREIEADSPCSSDGKVAMLPITKRSRNKKKYVYK